ncbi:MAG TPA: hypothetical protein VGD72_02080 [Mycobacteriales bacterium]
MSHHDTDPSRHPIDVEAEALDRLAGLSLHALRSMPLHADSRGLCFDCGGVAWPSALSPDGGA